MVSKEINFKKMYTRKLVSFDFRISMIKYLKNKEQQYYQQFLRFLLLSKKATNRLKCEVQKKTKFKKRIKVVQLFESISSYQLLTTSKVCSNYHSIIWTRIIIISLLKLRKKHFSSSSHYCIIVTIVFSR